MEEDGKGDLKKELLEPKVSDNILEEISVQLNTPIFFMGGGWIKLYLQPKRKKNTEKQYWIMNKEKRRFLFLFLELYTPVFQVEQEVGEAMQTDDTMSPSLDS